MTATASASVGSQPKEKTVRELRVELAAAYRLTAQFGMDDMLGTHISSRLPGEPIRFLINPYGLMFDEITASSLIAVDLDGNVVSDNKAMANPFGFTIHGAVQGAREDARCVLHTHTQAGMAVAAMKDGLLPLNQMSMTFFNRLAYYDYEALTAEEENNKYQGDEDEQRRMVEALGDKNNMIMRNHGLMTVGETMADAFYRMYYLDQSCRIQMNALAANTEIVLPSDETCEAVAVHEESDSRPKEQMTWDALVRKLDRIDPSFRN